ncbi:hypothetical protein ACMG4H_14075 [Corynebacterium glutamicum]|uniref:hypothetical protein n=1 Tax=Corynebacterium glutamicum TaxID=1718 RepID=UPI003C7C9BF7
MDNGNTLRLKVGGRPGEIDLKALEKSIGAISKLIAAVGGKNTTQCVKDLKTSSAVIDVLTEPEPAALISAGLNSLVASSSRPEKFDRSALTAINDLYRATQMPGVTEISFGDIHNPTRIGLEVHRNATTALEAERVSLGSVKGTLYKFNGRNGNLKAGIEHHRTGTAVELELQEKHVATVLGMMQSEVIVRGALYRDPITNIVTRVKVKDVEKVKPKDLPRPAYEMQGILGTDWLDGLDPVEIVRRERRA